MGLIKAVIWDKVILFVGFYLQIECKTIMAPLRKEAQYLIVLD
jgi:hypothetical protein